MLTRYFLPKRSQEKLVFIAGGIGITPFRSMLKYLVDTNERRDVGLVYMNKGPEDIVYRDVFDQAGEKLGIRTVYTFTETMPQGWTGRTGKVNDTMLQEEFPDFAERTFYVSGPHPMVAGVEATLLKMGVRRNRIKKDFFPGLA